VIVFVLLAAVLAGVAVGALLALRQHDQDQDAASSPASASRPTSTAGSTAAGPRVNSGTPADPRSAAPATSATATASAAPDYSPIGDDPAASGLDFGYLTAISTGGGVYTLTFDRATLYTGDAATAHNGGTPPPNDYLVENRNPAVRLFTVEPKAWLHGSFALAGSGAGPEGRAITFAELAAGVRRAAAEKRPVPVWLRHAAALDGPVTALKEQFFP
jgi:hypothetical protein